MSISSETQQPDWQDRPHVFYPDTDPQLFRGVLSRRFFAFLIDAAIIVLLTIGGYFLTLLLGILTFGLAWLMFGLVFPIVAILYTGSTLGGPRAATVGMRVMGLEMHLWDGEPTYFILGAAHAVLFWFSAALLTPFVVLIGFFNRRHRLLHDYILGTVVINTPAQAGSA